MKKILYIFLSIIVLFISSVCISSCENASVSTNAVLSVLDETEIPEDVITEAEPGILTEENPPDEYETTEEIPETAETTESQINKELIYVSPYSIDEIKNIFKEDKELFEKIKDIKMPDGYNYFFARNSYSLESPRKIEFYDFYDNNGSEKYISYDITENSEYKIIREFFDKYEHIYFIHSVDPEIGNYREENLIALFRLQMDAHDSESAYLPWAEIRYHRNGGEIKEEITGEYMIIPLDNHWYYIYSNVIFGE